MERRLMPSMNRGGESVPNQAVKDIAEILTYILAQEQILPETLEVPDAKKVLFLLERLAGVYHA